MVVRQFTKPFYLTLFLLLGGFPAAQAEEVALANAPLFISSAADPNLMFILDDSGSMRWGFIPDDLAVEGFNFETTDTVSFVDGSDITFGVCPDDAEFYAGHESCFFDMEGRQHLASNDGNPMYYDPDTEYSPPLKGDGSQFDDVDFTDAPVDGYDSDSLTIDLSGQYRAIMDEYYWVCDSRDDRERCRRGGDFNQVGFTISEDAETEHAFYYEFDDENCSEGDRGDQCYTKVQVSDEQRQNFANWYSYYRTRILASRAGITAAFIDQPEGMRVGYGAINVDGTIERGVRPFEGADRAQFFEWLHSAAAIGGTPLRQALNEAGQYYEDSSDTGPWADDPGVSDGQDAGEFVECRPSGTILMTDGYWNGPSPELGNVDGERGDEITGPGDRYYSGYDPEKPGPFSDDHSDTLADVAMYYWKRDLQDGTIKNRVPEIEPDEDNQDRTPNPAFWQHMMTYGVGLGVHGDIDPETAWEALENDESIDWPDPRDGDQEKIDDLLHAAVNSRGDFFSADDPDTFAEELGSLVSSFSEEIGAATGVTFDTATLEEDSLIFAAQFNSARWSGDLFASPLTTDEDDPDALPEIGPQAWSAAEILDARDLDENPRQIITSDGEQGIPFRWSEEALSETQLADLRFGKTDAEERNEIAEARVAYLRGDRSREGSEADDFRVRDSRLGDIVNSTPVRVSDPAAGWPDSDPFGEAGDPDNDSEEGNRYSDFRARQDGRTPVIYSGANDGMLHGFAATEDGGEEVLSFMPEAIFSEEPAAGLHYLTDPGYSHRYYVDLPPLVSDAFIRHRNEDGSVTNDPAWRTVLIGGARTGGKSIFALDVTEPERFDEANAAELVMWEFTAEDDSRMGYITEPPTIALADWDGGGDYRWTAFFGNGYNSEEEATGIFMLDLEGGLNGEWEDDDYHFIEFRDEDDDNVTGLSPVAVYDDTGDRTVDRIYGGDLDGNMWVAESSNQGFQSAYRSGQDADPLFTAQADGAPQAITSAPLVVRDSPDEDDDSADRLVLFGTGQYLNTSDLSNTQDQSLYAVRDAGTPLLERGDLAERDLYKEENFENTGSTVLLSDEISNTDDENGWYVDLVDDGERITLSPQVRGDFIFANSSIPSDNPCVGGGESRVMAFGLDGLTPDIPVFTGFDEAVVSYETVEGIASQSAFLGEFHFTPTSLGDVSIQGLDTGAPDELMGRQGWQELLE